MHSKDILIVALLGLSLFVLGLAVGQGWFTPQPAQAQFGDTVYTGPQIVYFSAGDASGTWIIVDIEGYWWKTYPTEGQHWERQSQILPPNTPIPVSTVSPGMLKGSYNK